MQRLLGVLFLVAGIAVPALALTLFGSGWAMNPLLLPKLAAGSVFFGGFCLLVGAVLLFGKPRRS